MFRCRKSVTHDLTSSKKMMKKKPNATRIILVLVWICMGAAVVAVAYARQTIQSSADFDRTLDILSSEGTRITTTRNRQVSILVNDDGDTRTTHKKADKAVVALEDANLVKDYLVDCTALTKQTAGKDPNPGPQYVVEVNQAPTANPFFISLHKFSFDPIRGFIHANQRYYEFKLEVAWAEILQNAPPEARILDVGGNVGYFSLLSAAMGSSFRVDTFEPNPLNLLRACESLEQNQWTNEYHPTVADHSTINL